MPRKAKADTSTTKSKKPIATKVSKTKPKSSITETLKHSEINLEYSRFGNLGFSHILETVDISFLSKKQLTGKITTLFHFIRQTEVCKNLDSGRIATFTIDYKPVIGITQKSNDYENQVFTLTKYKPDGTRQSTRKYSYNKTKDLILGAFGFETKIDEDEDTEQPEDLETSNEDMKIQAESGNFDDIE